MRWYGHVFRKDKDDMLSRALDFEVVERRELKRPKIITCALPA